MPQQIIDPIGVSYKWREGQVEYQLFPVEYFSGADIYLYFGDVWAEEVISLQYMLAENVLPITSYASYTWDFVARGTRSIQGEFAIAFKSAKYFSGILEHLGSSNETATPQLIKQTPDWVGDIDNKIKQVATNTTTADTSNLQTLKYGDTDAKTNNLVSKMQAALRNKAPAKIIVSAYDTSGWRSLLQTGMNGNDVRSLQQRLNQYGILKDNQIDGNFGNITAAAVREFQKMAGLTQDGKVGSDTRNALTDRYAADGIYGRVTQVAVWRFQKWLNLEGKGPISEDGKCGPQTWKFIIDELSTTPSELSDSNSSQDDVWNNDISTIPLSERKRNPYFYAGANSKNLDQKGFNLYVVYGPMPDYAINNAIAQGMPFNTTMKVIRNIQIISEGQVIYANGDPIATLYRFIAQDID